MRFLGVGSLGFLLVWGTALAQEPIPLGGQFQVNTYTTNYQRFPEVASDPQGDFVVVWVSVGSYGTDTSGQSVQAQRYDADGIPMGGQFQVNSYTTFAQNAPAVAADDQGDFVVVWHGKYQDDPNSGYNGILAQRYDAGGTPVGVELQVNSFTTHNQIDPSVEADAEGNFVVVWESFGPDGSSYSVQAQRYDAGGTPEGVEFQVNSYTTASQAIPEVDFGEQGDFVVVWQSRGSYGTDNNQASIQAQRYDDSGTPVGSEFQVNSYTTSWQILSAVAADDQGNFVVVWQSNGSYGTDTDSWSIQAQRYDMTGAPEGDQFQVNTYTTGGQEEPAVAGDAQGNLVVVWNSAGSDGTDTSSTSIQARVYDATGSPVGGQFQVNSYTTSDQYGATVALDPQGNFVVIWQSLGSYGTDASSASIQAQRFVVPIFADGFESGDTTDWSSTVP